MNVQSLFELQKGFNNTLNINTDLDSYKIKARKNLQFQIVLGALANETLFFNYLFFHRIKVFILVPHNFRGVAQPG